MKFISASLLICEKVLEEKDETVSAIRLIDHFRIASQPASSPIKTEDTVVRVSALGIMKVDDPDTVEHKVELLLLRPTGERVKLGEEMPYTFPVPPQDAVIPPLLGINLRIEFGLVAKEMGRHYIVMYFDREEITRAPFTLQLARAPKVD
jgi:hypothetical protein